MNSGPDAPPGKRAEQARSSTTKARSAALSACSDGFDNVDGSPERGDIAEEVPPGKGGSAAGRATGGGRRPVISGAEPAAGQQPGRPGSLPKGDRAGPACTARSAPRRARQRRRANGHRRRRPLSQPARARDPAVHRSVARPATQQAVRQKPRQQGVSWVSLISRRPLPYADPSRPPRCGTPPATTIDAGAVTIGHEVRTTSSPWSAMPAQAASAADLDEIVGRALNRACDRECHSAGCHQGDGGEAKCTRECGRNSSLHHRQLPVAKRRDVGAVASPSQPRAGNLPGELCCGIAGALRLVKFCNCRHQRGRPAYGVIWRETMTAAWLVRRCRSRHAPRRRYRAARSR
jgi:hypothetical protein